KCAAAKSVWLPPTGAQTCRARVRKIYKSKDVFHITTTIETKLAGSVSENASGKFCFDAITLRRREQS
ncbi:MAG: hypothetical protein IKZ20_00150, partial [Bacteroidaceae bacterium]|nr:hypothetical protein [Bacteroidaceae bacterium]